MPAPLLLPAVALALLAGLAVFETLIWRLRRSYVREGWLKPEYARWGRW